MGAQQVLRVAAVVGCLAVPLPAVAQSAEPVIVVDIRPGDDGARRASREAFLGELGQVAGVQLVTDRALIAALALEPLPPVGAEARKRASVLMSQLLVHRTRDDCAARGTVARDAARLLAGLQAAGRAVDAELQLVYVYVLRCADRAGDTTAASDAAALLMRLGISSAPPDLDPALWSKYATPTPASVSVSVSIDGTPAGADVWIDHANVGVAPLTIDLLAGHHLVGVATADGVNGQWIDAQPGDSATVSYQIEQVEQPWAEARATVQSWKDRTASANALAIAKLMTLAGVRFAVVLADDDRAQLWTLPPQASAARRLRGGIMRTAMPLANAIVEEVRRLEGKPVDGDVQILTEPAAKKKKAPQKWWVYASIVGAVALGAGIIIANDLADDHQRVELSWP